MTDQLPEPQEAAKKRPASQYYWGDWWKDKGLHSCSLPARGLWHEMNCLMHEGEPYGHLTLNGRPMTVAQLANQCRISAAQCAKLLRELEDAGVPSKTPEGVLYSRRMVRDEAVRNARASGGKGGAEHGIKGAEFGVKGGRPKGSKGGSETPLTPGQKPPPSSSSSSSSSPSVKRTPPPPEGAGRFAEFWAVWPKSPRKGGKPECLKLWQSKHLEAEADAIIDHVRALAATDGWTKAGGEFVPAPAVYLRGRRWDGAELAQAGAGSSSAPWLPGHEPWAGAH